MGLSGAEAIHWVLPVALVVAWTALWVTPRRLPRFFAFAFGVAFLCIPAGVVAGRIEMDGVDCAAAAGCFSTDAVHWWLNGVLGFLTCGVLGALTLSIELVVAMVRRLWTRPPPTATDVARR